MLDYTVHTFQRCNGVEHDACVNSLEYVPCILSPIVSLRAESKIHIISQQIDYLATIEVRNQLSVSFQ